jgi:hypothetical protein
MKREYLTWQTLWPFIGDGQCFDYQHMNGSRPFKFIDGMLYVWSTDTQEWCSVATGLEGSILYKLVDDPSQPKPQDDQLQDRLETLAIDIFGVFVFDRQAQRSAAQKLLRMFFMLHADLLKRIEEKTK